MGDAVNGGAVTDVGIVGLGVISAQYLDTLLAAPRVRIAAVADLDASRAEAAWHPWPVLLVLLTMVAMVVFALALSRGADELA